MVAMKKIAFLFLSAVLCLLPFSAVPFVRAEETPALPAILGEEMNLGEGITDGYLYQALLLAYNTMYENEDGFVPLTKVRENMFENATTLNLQNSLIYNLNGFALLNMPNLLELNLSKNRIATIGLELLAVPQLTSLNLFDNRLTSIQIPYLTNLQVLNLNKNQLSSISLENISSGTVHLSNNRFTSLSSITMPTTPNGLTVELFANNITNAQPIAGVTLAMGIQGVGLLNSGTVLVQTQHAPKWYGITQEDVVLTIQNVQTQEVVATYSFEHAFGTQILLPFGTYLATYQTTNGEPVFVATDPLLCAFASSNQFTMVPSVPTAQFLYKGQTLPYVVKINDNTKLMLSSPDENAVLYYQLPNQEWMQANEVLLPQLGRYTVAVKSVVNGTSSEVVHVFVVSDNQEETSEWVVVLGIFGIGALFASAVFVTKQVISGNLKLPKWNKTKNTRIKK